VVFEEESGDRTRVTVIWEVYGSATPEEVATFINGRSGMTQGWGGSFDRLDEYVASSGVKVA
ncbi:MAG TPA: SRPBCC domain-containing protein, partial [Leptospiraceae bacterium]|nr:SRPBCC domain-containing protein [Leptospiraceae bacterium]